MPAKSKKQFRFIYAMRNKYKSRKKAPKNMKWVFDKEWTENVDFKKLPERIKKTKNESFDFVLKFKNFLKYIK